MTQPHDPGHSAPAQARPNLLRWAIWVAIGALILAAIVCVIWVLVGPDNDIIGRAFLTILLLAAFAGVAILETHLAPRRPDWFALTSMITWVVTLLLGAFLVWMPLRDDAYGLDGFGRFVSFLVIVLVLQLAVLHVRLFTKAMARNATAFNRTAGIVTIVLVAVLAVMLVMPLTFHEFIDFDDFYWRVVVAVAILAAVGTALVPLVNALFAPKRERPVAAYGQVPAGYGHAPGYAPQGPAGHAQAAPHAQGYPAQGHGSPAGYPGTSAAPAPHTPAAQPWPTYADGVTPLPVMPDGSPDWNAYYTGYPSTPQAAAPQHSAASSEQSHAGPEQGGSDATQPGQPPAGYQGYPPQPPLPPR